MSKILVQRFAPYGDLRPPKILPLACEKIDPFIRIAHRIQGRINIPGRIIFDHELVLMLRGYARYECDGRVIPVSPGHLLFIAPFRPHALVASTATTHVAVHFDFRRHFPTAGADPSRRGPYQVRLSHGMIIPEHVVLAPDDAIQARLLQIVKAVQSSEPSSPLRAKACLLDVIAGLAQRSSNHPGNQSVADPTLRNRRRVERVIAHINAHLSEPHSAQRLAKVGGMSVSHFTRLFREMTGYSPMEFVRRSRVNHARHLLADIDLSIKEIAARAGFDDPYHFSKVFHRIDGLSPSHYRDALLAGRR